MTEFPDVIRIESVGRCNFKCTHCPVGVYGNKRTMMSFETFKRIFDSLPLVPRVLVLYHGGEPLLNRELEDMIRYAKSKGVQKTCFNSNASLLTVDRGKSLKEAGLDELRISFDGSSPEENDRIRVGSNFAKHAPIVREVAKDLYIRIYNIKFDGDPNPAKYLRDFFGTSVDYHTDPARIWASLNDDAQQTKSPTYCEELMETMSILSNGNVVSCCEDLLGEVTYGNVLEESPLAIWGRMQETRNSFENKNYPDFCRKCYKITGKMIEAK
jgi:radical SAM protein with 4Fe4S-binding SPASM domain